MLGFTISEPHQRIVHISVPMNTIDSGSRDLINNQNPFQNNIESQFIDYFGFSDLLESHQERARAEALFDKFNNQAVMDWDEKIKSEDPQAKTSSRKDMKVHGQFSRLKEVQDSKLELMQKLNE